MSSALIDETVSPSAESDYYANPRLSNSKLSVLASSPELFDAYYVSRTMTQEPTDEMTFGSMLHCFTLEPSQFDRQFAVKPRCDRRTNVGKAIWEAFIGEVNGRTIVDPDDFLLAGAIAKAMNNNSGVLRLLSLPGSRVENELTFARNEVGCKAKLDVLNLDCGLIIDLKTASDPSPKGFSRSTVDYGYHRQAAMYIDAVKQTTGIDCRMVFLVVNKKAPFVSAIYELSSELVDIGRMELDGLIEEYKRRSSSGNWVSDWADGSVHEIVKPKWY